MPIKSPFYPIIYVRGYAATQGAIESTTATPYMGFNLGATKLRQNHDGDVMRFIFESPLLRLMKDHHYEDTFAGGDLVRAGQEVSPKSVWIFRYYEKASNELGIGRRQTLPEIALDLRKFILRIRDHVAKDPESRERFRVYLVAHSMGGLVCRCYLQNICAAGTGNAALDKELELDARPRDAEGYLKDSTHLVDKVFTYATPHNGIEFLGKNVPDLGHLDKFHTRNFNRPVMHKYLKLNGDFKKGARVDSLNKAFREQRFFCLVGTDFASYQAFSGIASKSTGAMSDGLVMIRNATVNRAPRAFAHRAHSGHYGIVNSEEGYQNLRRFLFGNLHVDVRLAAESIAFPKKIQKLKDKGKKILASYQIETTAVIRGEIPYLHRRRFDESSAIRRNHEELIDQNKKVYLFSGYLLESEKTQKSGDTALAFAVQLKIRVPMYEVDREFWFDTHYEGAEIFADTMTLKIRRSKARTTVRYGIASRHGLGEAPTMAALVEKPGGHNRIEIPLQQGSSFRGRLILDTKPWNV